jgi:hypothetical protein
MKNGMILFFALLMGQLARSQWTTSGSNIYSSNAGNVGIGTTSPQAKLDVTGAIYANAVNAESHFSNGTYSDPHPGAGYAIKVGSGGIAVNGNATFMSGNLGVGTTTPLSLVQIGSLGLGGAHYATSTVLSVFQPFNYDIPSASIDIGLGGVHGRITGYGSTTDNSQGQLAFSTDQGGTVVEAMRITNQGNIGINTTDTKGYRLAVNGGAIFTQVVVKAWPWPDYVFKKEYQLPSLSDVARYIQANGHLPDMPSAASVKRNGINLGASQAGMLKKIEELTLYMIGQDKKMQEQDQQLEEQEQRLREQNDKIRQMDQEKKSLMERLDRLEKRIENK